MMFFKKKDKNLAKENKAFLQVIHTMAMVHTEYYMDVFVDGKSVGILVPKEIKRIRITRGNHKIIIRAYISEYLRIRYIGKIYEQDYLINDDVTSLVCIVTENGVAVRPESLFSITGECDYCHQNKEGDYYQYAIGKLTRYEQKNTSSGTSISKEYTILEIVNAFICNDCLFQRYREADIDHYPFKNSLYKKIDGENNPNGKKDYMTALYEEIVNMGDEWAVDLKKKKTDLNSIFTRSGFMKGEPCN